MLLKTATPELLEERRKKVLAVDFSASPKEKEVFHKPLSDYNKEGQTLYETVMAKWLDEDKRVMDEYITQVNSLPSSEHFKKERDIALGNFAHGFVCKREQVGQDCCRQVQMAKLYERSKEFIPKINKMTHNLFKLFIIGAIASCASTGVYLQNKSNSSAEIATLITFSIMGAAAIGKIGLSAEKYRIDKQNKLIKAKLFYWHKMPLKEQILAFDHVMKPSQMGLVGFIDTFRTKT